MQNVASSFIQEEFFLRQVLTFCYVPRILAATGNLLIFAADKHTDLL